ncbi:MAG TPA: amidohydrolase family protein [Kofleriaceae bacterium]|nr:amidohydrolase family protein [Kofleriaceae bacterium]
MSTTERTTPGSTAETRRIRDRLDHPVIDSDAHIIEYLPDVHDRIRALGGAKVASRFERKYATVDKSVQVPLELSRRYGITRTPWWNYPARNAYDRATATLPRLLYDRLPELGIDFAVVYPSYFVQFPVEEDDEFRRLSCRATNQHVAATFQGLGDRMIPVATIPMHTPDEALSEIEYATKELGYRAVVLPGWVLRRVPGTDRTYLDTFGLESPLDYDPVWRYLEDHGLAATFHSGGMGWGSRALTKNYMHNHLGHFGAAGEATARGLIFAGVPVRFPRLRFAFLEGGAGWGATLYTSLVSHFAKRNKTDIHHYNPAHMDVELIGKLARQYGCASITDRIDRLAEALVPLSYPMNPVPDDFATTGFTSKADIRKVFERSIFLGCEGDDPMNACASTAFGRGIGVQLNPLYGSDIGHWDVPDLQDILHEAHELVDHGVFAPADFRRMVFDAPVRLWADNNPGFFRGTTVEAAVAKFRSSSEAMPS